MATEPDTETVALALGRYEELRAELARTQEKTRAMGARLERMDMLHEHMQEVLQEELTKQYLQQRQERRRAERAAMFYNRSQPLYDALVQEAASKGILLPQRSQLYAPTLDSRAPTVTESQ